MTVLFSYGFVARQLRKPNRFRKKYRQSKITLRLAILLGVTRDANSEKIINVAYATATGNWNECQIYFETFSQIVARPYVDMKLIPRVDSEYLRPKWPPLMQSRWI